MTWAWRFDRKASVVCTSVFEYCLSCATDHKSGGVSKRSVAFCRGLGASKRGVTFRTEREAAKMFSRGFPLFSSWPSTGIVRSNTEVRSEIYGRFMVGSDQNRSSLGRLGQSVQHMQIAQSRINTGYFASR